MKPLNKVILLVTILLVLVVAFMLATQLPDGGVDAPTIVASPPADAADRRPMFRLLDVDGAAHNVTEWDGKVLAINFWATWCGPCRKEIPEFIQLQTEYGESGVQFVGVAIDSAENVRAYAEELGINYPLLVGDDDAIATGLAYGNVIGALPFTAIVDRSGRIVLRQQGVLSHELAVTTIKSLL